METVTALLGTINGKLWGWPMIIILVGTHIFLTIRLKGIQRYIWYGIRLSLQRKKEGSGDISQFGALTTALAATVGTGNIAGVATAITAGGPGAVLWMWLTGVFGIATKYGEALLSVKYRIVTSDGSFAGGPMYVLERGLKSKPLGIVFAIFTALAAFGIGNTVQSHEVAMLVHETFNIEPWITGVVLAVMTALVILGGVGSIARTCERLVPFMAFFYVAGCVMLMITFAADIFPAIKLIISSAFSGQAAAGGFLGAGVRESVRYGVARGLFSNESGMGSAPIVAAAAQTKNPVRQALVSATGTFWDTVVICALTGIVIVASGEWVSGASGVALSKAAFSHLSKIGPYYLTIGLFVFVFSTILGWSYYGEKAVEYLLGKRSIKPYRYLWIAGVMIGAVVNDAVWSFADISNALMALPNILALLLLSGVIARETREYFKGTER
ncbi:MAG: sodium:alanine symporter family protein [Chitinispirillaceae bacterium]|nr:sodium:alanine symporter family protein [Chitinispirillaceae bacterium]